jgi:hypothetical protein
MMNRLQDVSAAADDVELCRLASRLEALPLKEFPRSSGRVEKHDF